MVAPQGCACGNSWCSGCSNQGTGNKREIIVDPRTNRAFLFSTDQLEKGRPEFLFLDIPADMNLLPCCSKIITNYDEANEVPVNLQVLEKDPFNDGQVLSFVARVLDKDAGIAKMLQRNYLYHKSTDIVVMIPIMHTEEWGGGSVPIPSGDYTDDSLDNWIRAVARSTGAYGGN